MEKDEIEVMVAEWQRVREMIEDGRDYEAYAASSTKDWDDEEWDMSQYVGEDGRIKAPRSLPEAMSRPDWQRWEEAYQIEFDMIMVIKAVLSRPMTRAEFRKKGVRNKPTPLQLLFDVKYENGKIRKYKCRMVLCGTSYFVKNGITFSEKYSASPNVIVARIMTASMILHDME